MGIELAVARNEKLELAYVCSKNQLETKRFIFVKDLPCAENEFVLVDTEKRSVNPQNTNLVFEHNARINGKVLCSEKNGYSVEVGNGRRAFCKTEDALIVGMIYIFTIEEFVNDFVMLTRQKRFFVNGRIHAGAVINQEHGSVLSNVEFNGYKGLVYSSKQNSILTIVKVNDKKKTFFASELAELLGESIVGLKTEFDVVLDTKESSLLNVNDKLIYCSTPVIGTKVKVLFYDVFMGTYVGTFDLDKITRETLKVGDVIPKKLLKVKSETKYGVFYTLNDFDLYLPNIHAQRKSDFARVLMVEPAVRITMKLGEDLPCEGCAVCRRQKNKLYLECSDDKGHCGVVAYCTDRGAKVEFYSGIEGFLPNRDLKVGEVVRCVQRHLQIEAKVFPGAKLRGYVINVTRVGLFVKLFPEVITRVKYVDGMPSYTKGDRVDIEVLECVGDRSESAIVGFERSVKKEKVNVEFELEDKEIREKLATANDDERHSLYLRLLSVPSVELLQEAMSACDHKRLLKAFLPTIEGKEHYLELSRVAKNKNRICVALSCCRDALLRSELYSLDEIRNNLTSQKFRKFLLKYGRLLYDLANKDVGRSVFERLLSEEDSKENCISYIECEQKNVDVAYLRNLFKRVSTFNLRPSEMRVLFDRYLQFEKEHGDIKTQDAVVEAAETYASKRKLSSTNSSKKNAC